MGSLRVKIWGTRGLIASPRLNTAFFGGNTPCIQLLHENHLILIDTGFGCTNLGDELMPHIITDGGSLKIHIFYTHFHWDHVQGLPFFKPIYFSTTTMHLYSPEATTSMLDNLNILFDGSYSPFESLLGMQARVHLHQLKGPLTLDGLNISFHPVDHGTAMHAAGVETYAYKFTNAEGESVCVMTDHEARATARNKALVAWAKDCDLLIHDGQFDDTEYQSHCGWGHSSARMALDNAIKINPGMTLLTHHDPASNDRDIQQHHRELMQGRKYRKLNFAFAREDIVYEVARQKTLKKAG